MGMNCDNFAGGLCENVTQGGPMPLFAREYIVNHHMSDHFNQTLAECVKCLHWFSTKYATVRIRHCHVLKCIVQSMLVPTLSNCKVIGLRN